MSTRTQSPVSSDERMARSQRLGQTKRHAKQRATSGGLRWGSAFCGWCATVGMASMLAALLTAAGAAFAVSRGGTAVLSKNPYVVDLIGAGCIFAGLFLAFYVGGRVAGRMARVDGGRQGFAVWVWGMGIVIAVVIAIAALGLTYDLYRSIKPSQLPVGGTALIAALAAATVVTAVATLGAAVHGGRRGARLPGKFDPA